MMRSVVAFVVFFLCALQKIDIAFAVDNADDRPNFIVLQPDDFEFFDEWTPPAPFREANAYTFPDSGLPNIERLRQNGVQMMQAYTASSQCGTSRYSTITGRYPSRSSYGRELNNADSNGNSYVRIPTTKLLDTNSVVDGNDCSDNNVAALLQKNGYRTGVVGKWHLWDGDDYTYDSIIEEIESCGFDYADAIYRENLDASWNDGTFSHNMEYVTAKAIEFIEADDEQPFFLYVNPTAPHGGAGVSEALNNFPCTTTPSGDLDEEPSVVTMTEGTTCEDYRQTIFDRANGDTDDKILGSIWVDDGIGAILQALEDSDKLDNTFFLFQMDHGQEGKRSLYEQGIRLAQFVHFPAHLGDVTNQYDGLVSTVDIVPTILDYAGIDADSTGYYEMDGQSWRSAVEGGSGEDDDRCLFFELEYDRAIRCGCYKYLTISEDDTQGGTTVKGERFGLAVGPELVFNLCDGSDTYETSNVVEQSEMEEDEELYDDLLSNFQTLQACHNERTLATTQPQYEQCDSSYTPPSSEPNPSPAVPALCLSGQTVIHEMTKGSVSIEEFLKNYDTENDKIMVASSSSGSGTKQQQQVYQPVFSFGHINFYATSTFLQVETTITNNATSAAAAYSKNRFLLEISPEHLIFQQDDDEAAAAAGLKNNKGVPIRADHLRVGDLLHGTINNHNTMVTNIRRVQKQGIFSPLVNQGQFVVAGGVVVSSYTAVSTAMRYLTIFGTEIISHHDLSHIVMAPFRALCFMSSYYYGFDSDSGTTVGVCNDRNAEGQLLFAATGEQIMTNLLFLSHDGIIQAAVFLLLAVFALPTRGLELMVLWLGVVEIVVGMILVSLLLLACMLHPSLFKNLDRKTR